MKDRSPANMPLFPAPEETTVFTVSQLNARIKDLLEAHHPFLWIQGEISNLRMPASGHLYFTLKDEHSQIRAVLFRVQKRRLRFVPEEGLQVLCQGRLSVYEPRGEYQIIAEVMEPLGVGALQLAFEQLKRKLEQEGLFDPDRKRPLPLKPQRIAVVTSATGAAIRDMLKVFERSPYPLTVTVLPVRVQGVGAGDEIAAAVRAANSMASRFAWDVLIVGRGGGSLEDLWAFNEEVVARAVAASKIPVVSAVGHEIDVTISDLVADLRAPTPTAAAEWVVARLEDLERSLADGLGRLQRVAAQTLERSGRSLDHLAKRLADPRRRLSDLRMLVDDRLDRLDLALSGRLGMARETCRHLVERLRIHHPERTLAAYRVQLQRAIRELSARHRGVLDRHRFRLQEGSARLETLSPLAVLARGYSVTERMPDGGIVRQWHEVEPGASVRVRLSEGSLECRVVTRLPGPGLAPEKGTPGAGTIQEPPHAPGLQRPGTEGMSGAAEKEEKRRDV